MNSVLASRRLPDRTGQLVGLSVTLALGAAIGILAAINPKFAIAAPVLALLTIVILGKPIVGLYAIAALLPFESLAILSAGVTAAKIIGGITFVAWLKESIEGRVSTVRFRGRETLFLLFFLSIAALSVSQSKILIPSLSRLLTVFFLGGLYFITLNLLSDQRRVKTIISILVVAGALAAIVQIALFLSGTAGRDTGVAGDPNHSALNLLILVPLAVALAAQQSSRRNRLLCWGAFALLVTGTFILLSRGATVALLAVFVLMAGDRVMDKPSRRLMSAIALTLVLATLAVAVSDPRFTLSVMKASGGAGRLFIWSTAARIFGDNWLFGIGLEGFKQTYYEYAVQVTSIPASVLNPLHAHNMYIEVAVETGVFGFLTFMSFIISSILALAKARGYYHLNKLPKQAIICSGLLASLCGLLVGVIFLNALSKKALWLLLGLAAAQYSGERGRPLLNGQTK